MPSFVGQSSRLSRPQRLTGRLYEFQGGRTLLDCGPIVHVPLHGFGVGAMLQAPLHVLSQPLLHLLGRGLPAPRCCSLDNVCRAGHDAEEIRVLEANKVAQALHARRHVDSPLELVFFDLLGRVPLNANEIEGPIKNQLLECCCSLCGAFFFCPIISQPNCVDHDVHAQSLELAELGLRK